MRSRSIAMKVVQIVVSTGTRTWRKRVDPPADFPGVETNIFVVLGHSGKSCAIAATVGVELVDDRAKASGRLRRLHLGLAGHKRECGPRNRSTVARPSGGANTWTPAVLPTRHITYVVVAYTAPSTLYAARGRLIPFNSNSPTGSTLMAFSTFISTRGLMRI